MLAFRLNKTAIVIISSVTTLLIINFLVKLTVSEQYFLAVLYLSFPILLFLIFRKKILLLFILFTVNFLKFSSISGTFLDHVLQYANAIIYAGALICFYQTITDAKIKHNRHIYLAYFMLLGVVTLSALDNGYSFYMTAKSIYVALWGINISFIIIHSLTDKKIIEFFTKQYIYLTTFSVAIIGMVQIYLGERIIKAGFEFDHHNYYTPDHYRLSGLVLTNALLAASALLYLCLILLAWFLAKKKHGWYLFLFFINLIALILTASRSAALLLAASVISMLLFTFKSLWDIRKRTTTFVLITVFIIAIMFIIGIALPSTRANFMDFSASADARLQILQNLKYVEFKALLGRGPLNRGRMENYVALGYANSFENMYVEWFYKTGIAGTFFMLYFIFIGFKNYITSYRYFTKIQMGEYQMLSCGFGLAFGCFCIFGLAYDVSFWGFYPWFLWAMSFVFLRLAEENVQKSSLMLQR